MYSLATPKQTGNLHFAFEATEPPGGGPPLHTQTYEEEIFFVLEGEITFWIDGEVIKRLAGGTVFVPRGVPHCFNRREQYQSPAPDGRRGLARSRGR